MNFALAFTCPFLALSQTDSPLALLFDLILDNGFNFLLVSTFRKIERHDVVMSRLGGNELFNGLVFRLRVRLDMKTVPLSAVGQSDSFTTIETKAELLLLMGCPGGLGLPRPDSGLGQLCITPFLVIHAKSALT